jgi:citronellol/citronellal dehydrogenase
MYPPLSPTLEGRVVFITGGSRGIGRAIALRAARDGASVAVAAKTSRPHPRLPGTIHTVAAEIEEAGGRALPIELDIRDADGIARAIAHTVETFGGLDVLIHNAGAIFLASTPELPAARFDLMHAINTRAAFLCAQAALPHLRRSSAGQILCLAPPPTLNPFWYRHHLGYTLSKMGMSLVVLGLADELRPAGVRVNALWPRTVIATAALAMLGGAVRPQECRRPEIVADAAHWILTRSGETSGRFFLDEDALRSAGVTDFRPYNVDPESTRLAPDIFLDSPEVPA